MNMLALLRVCLRALMRNKMRSSLTMLGIVIGVAAVISMVAITDGARLNVQQQISSLGDNVFMVFSGAFHMAGVRQTSGSRSTLTMEDVEAIGSQCPNVRLVSPSVRTGAQLVYGNQNWSTSVWGVAPEFADIRRYEVNNGRMFNETDMRGAAKVCVVGQTIVDNLYAGSDPVGSIIRIKRLPFEVIGVLAAKGQSAMGQDQDDMVLVPFTTVAKKFNAGNTRVSQIIGSASSGDALTTAVDEVTNLMRTRHRIGKDEDDDFIIRTQADIANTVESSAKTMGYLLGSVALVSLLVGGIGIMNIMLVSVTERTREIGIRMSVGARQQDILWQFMLEAIILSALGGLLGIGLGAGVSLIISKVAGWASAISPLTALLALGFASLVGIFFGFYPARKASMLDPIEALRYE
ncbi:FtsX-like permease family protein [candidate division KSB1 bacterium]|nr:MAG: FtsX-like permease family protein [candidate division KSB1 bacterium]